MSEKGPAIGIDFGTSTCSVAVYHQGKVEVIPNDVGKRMTPSCVSFTSNGHLIGEASKKILREKPSKNDIYDVKRLIGRRYDDVHVQTGEMEVQTDMKLWPFSVINHQGKPIIKVDCEGEKEAFFPEEMASILLVKMKEIAEAHLEKKVTQAVISVPANFNDSQRRAVKDAGTIAGLDVIRIINEPSAAAIAYGFQNKNKTKRNIIIFDLGGGTCDVSVMKIENGSSFTVKSTRGDTHLGGIEFDNRLVDHFVEVLKEKYKKDISNNKSTLCRLRLACEEAKILLSSSMEAPIEINSLIDDINFKSSISRPLFEELNDDLFFCNLELLQSAIRDAGLDKSEIDELILIGGSTHIPRIKQMLHDFLPGLNINESMNSNEAVASGAALQAAILQCDQSDSLKKLVVFDVAPLSLGVYILGGMMRTVIECNTTIPVSKKESFNTLRHGQQSLIFPIGEGECVKVDGNKLLGKISLNGIHPAPGADHQIEINFRIDANGCLKVFTYQGEVKIESDITFDDARLERKDFERLEEYDKEVKERLRLEIEKRDLEKARDALKSYCNDVSFKFEEGKKRCQQILLYLQLISDDIGGDAVTWSKEYVEQKKKDLDRIIDEICLIQELSNEPNGGNSCKRQRTRD